MAYFNIINNLYKDSNACSAVLTDNIDTSIRSDGSYLNRLVCRWTEKTTEKDGSAKIKNHVFAAGMDTNNQVYLDCRKRLVFSKLAVSTLVRPLHGFVKTLYHLSMIPIVKNIISAAKGESTGLEAFTASVKSLADIIRTPLYETAMIITGFAGLIAAPFCPKSLYRFREAIAKIEEALFREKFHDFTLTPCFQARDLQMLVEDYGVQNDSDEKGTEGGHFLVNFADTDYGDYSVEEMLKAKIITKVEEKNEEGVVVKTAYKMKKLSRLNETQKTILQKALATRAITNYGRAMIKTRRKNYNPFYQMFGKLSADKTYVTPGIDPSIFQNQWRDAHDEQLVDLPSVPHGRPSLEESAKELPEVEAANQRKKHRKKRTPKAKTPQPKLATAQ